MVMDLMRFYYNSINKKQLLSDIQHFNIMIRIMTDKHVRTAETLINFYKLYIIPETL